MENKKFIVKLEERFMTILEVEAKTEEEADEKVRELYNKGKIPLERQDVYYFDIEEIEEKM